MRLRNILILLAIIFFIYLAILSFFSKQIAVLQNPQTWQALSIFNLIYFSIFVLLTIISVSTLNRKIRKHDTMVKDLKVKLYETLKDDADREKMIKDFDKFLKDKSK